MAGKAGAARRVRSRKRVPDNRRGSVFGVQIDVRRIFVRVPTNFQPPNCSFVDRRKIPQRNEVSAVSGAASGNCHVPVSELPTRRCDRQAPKSQRPIRANQRENDLETHPNDREPPQLPAHLGDRGRPSGGAVDHLFQGAGVFGRAELHRLGRLSAVRREGVPGLRGGDRHQDELQGTGRPGRHVRRRQGGAGSRRHRHDRADHRPRRRLELERPAGRLGSGEAGDGQLPAGPGGRRRGRAQPQGRRAAVCAVGLGHRVAGGQLGRCQDVGPAVAG